jgi:hypothetical protein
MGGGAVTALSSALWTLLDEADKTAVRIAVAEGVYTPPAGRVWDDTLKVLSDVVLVERQIERALRATPLERRPLVYGCFMTCFPRLPMPYRLIEAHALEIARRVAKGEDVLRAATGAEVATIVMEFSIKVPLSGEAMYTQYELLCHLLPRLMRDIGFDPKEPPETYKNYRRDLRRAVRDYLTKKLPPRAAPVAKTPTGKLLDQFRRRGIFFPVPEN